MADSQEFKEVDLAGLIAHEIRQAQDYDQSENSQNRATTLEYLRGEMSDTPPRPNGSTVTSRDVNDTIAWILPGIMRVFMASDRVADYEPTIRDGQDPNEAEEQADQASDYASYVFFKDNDGYRVVYNATHEALTLGDGAIKHYWDDTPETEISHHSGLTLQQVVELTDSPDIEVLTQSEGVTVTLMDELGQPVEVPTYDIKIERTLSSGRIRIESIERENFIIDSAARVVEEARFIAHRDPYVTRSDLIEMGFDREVVDDLSTDSNFNDTEEGFSRRQDDGLISDSLMRSTQRIDLYECYLKADVDDDGIAETIRAYYAGDAGAGKVLDWEVWEDEVPFSVIPCYPNPHKFESESVADRTRDLQKIKTILMRQGLDNLYVHNLPHREVEEKSVLNPDILVSPKFGGVIWKKANSAPIVSHAVPFVADKVFTALDYFDQVRAQRTGVSDGMMALDPEALQNQSATANQNARDASYSQIELIARNMAELGWRRVFRQLLKLIVKHQDRPRMIRLRGEFVEMDPRHWNASMDCTVNVGLGTGSRDRDMAMLNVIKQDQMLVMDRLAAVGFSDAAIEMLPRLRRTLIKSAESAGLRNPDSFWPEIGDEEVQSLKQKAKEMEGQPSEQMQIEQAKLQVQMKAEQMKAEGNKIKEEAQLQADLVVKEAERHNAILIEGEKNAIARQKMMVDADIRREEIASRERIAYLQIQDKQRDRDSRANSSGGGSQASAG